MSDARQSQESAATHGRPARPGLDPSRWIGFVIFAAIIMVMIGVFHAIEGLIAIFRDSYFAVPSTRLVISVDYTAWGWIHLILGLVICAAGYGLLSGRSWARVVALCLALLSAFLNILFLTGSPAWSTVIIVLDILVIYSLTVHGSDVKALR